MPDISKEISGLIDGIETLEDEAGSMGPASERLIRSPAP